MRPNGGRTRDDGDDEMFADPAGGLRGNVEQARAGVGGSADRSQTGGTAGSLPGTGFSLTEDADLGRLPAVSPGATRRSQPSARAKRRLPLAALIIGALILAGAAFLFWPASPPPPISGIGEQRSIVTSGTEGVTGTDDTRPVSGDVDLTREIAPLVPENPAGNAPRATATPARRPVARAEVAAPAVPKEILPKETLSSARPAPSTTLAPQPAELRGTASQAEPPAPPPPEAGVTVPGPTGGWAVQLGAFSSQENADLLLTRLRAKGLEPRVVTGSAAGGGLVYKVWLGYFTTREHAAAYAQRHAGDFGVTGIAVHR